ncbi:Ig-like domain-containing protein [Paenibacillus sp. TRM 82003]|nr:Ig-like domain-containing protein [Paenibacillus sp. TRM 82003]
MQTMLQKPIAVLLLFFVLLNALTVTPGMASTTVSGSQEDVLYSTDFDGCSNVPAVTDGGSGDYDVLGTGPFGAWEGEGALIHYKSGSSSEYLSAHCSLLLRQSQASATVSASTSGYTDIRVDFHYRTESSSQISVRLFSEYSTDGGATWTLADTIEIVNSNEPAFIPRSIVIQDEAAENSGLLKFRFRRDNVTKKMYVDDFRIYGQRMPDAPTEVPLTAIHLNETAVSLDMGAGLGLTPFFTPADATTNTAVTWSSSRSDVATVNEHGYVAAVGYGTATIRVQSEDATIFDECVVTIEPTKAVIYETGFDQYAEAGLIGGDGNHANILGSLPNDPWRNEGALLYYKASSSGYIKSIPTSARLYADNSMTVSVSTAVYGNLSVSYWYRTHNAAGTYPLYVEWSGDNGETWNAADTNTETTTTFKERTFTIQDPSASDNAYFKLRFRAGSESSSSVYVDDLAIHGEPLPNIPVTSMALNRNAASIARNEILQLSVSQVAPLNATGLSAAWSTSDSSVAVVNGRTGSVTPVSTGTAIIRATNIRTGVFAETEVTVRDEIAYVPVTGVAWLQPEYSVYPGQTLQLNGEVVAAPVNAMNPAIQWSVADTAVAVISEQGSLTGMSEGQTTVRAASVSEAVYAETVIRVEAEPESARRLTAFGFEQPKATGIVDHQERTITVKVPAGTDLREVTAVFFTTGTGVYVDGVKQTSGASALDYSRPVVFEVRGLSNASTLYTVHVQERGTRTEPVTYRVSNLAELLEANKQALPGDTIVMKNGTWTDVDFTLAGDGEPGKPITLRAETQGNVFLEGASRITVSGSYLVVDGVTFRGRSPRKPYGTVTFDFLSHHSRLTNTVIDDFNPTDTEHPTMPGEDHKHPWVMNKGTYNRIDHNSFTRKAFTGEMMRMFKGIVHHARIDHNYFGEREEDLANGSEAIQVGLQADTQDEPWGSYDSFTVIEHNYFYRWLGEIELVSFKSSNNVFRYNTIEESPGTVTMRISNHTEVYGNYFLQNHFSGTGGIRVYGTGHKIYNNYFEGTSGQGDQRVGIALQAGLDDPTSKLDPQPAKDVLVAFNTFVDCKTNCITLGASPSASKSMAPDGITIANNIAYSTSGTIFKQSLPQTNTVFEGNLFYGTELGIPLPASGIDRIDPQVVRGEDGRYRPSENSPAIGAAQGAYGEIVEDIEGQPRIGAYDIGADQASTTAPIVNRPLTRADVGPVAPGAEPEPEPEPGNSDNPPIQPGKPGNGALPSNEVEDIVVQPNGDAALKLALSSIGTSGTADIDEELLNKAFDAAAADSTGRKTVVIQWPGADGETSDTYETALPRAFFSAGRERQVVIQTGAASVSLRGDMLGHDAFPKGEKVTLAISRKSSDEWHGQVRGTIGDRPIVNLDLLVNGVKVPWANKESTVSVSVPYTPSEEEALDPEHIVVWYVDDAGEATTMVSGRYDGESGRVTFETHHFSIFAIAYVRKTFDDLSSHPWAQKQIEVLASKGVITGMTSETFAPETPITRADFLLLLIRGLELRGEAAAVGFKDVHERDYYYEAIGVAQRYGIASGVGEGRFEPASYITRQDMMTMAARAWKASGVRIEGASADLDIFADNNDIAPYARESIGVLVQEGIVQGHENVIRPLGTATRAEAAVLLYKLYSK